MEDLYSSVAKMYETDRQKNSLLEAQRRSEVYAKIPRIQEIDDTFTSNSLYLAKLFLETASESEREQKFNAYKQNSELLNAEKDALLAENGYPADYLEPIYTCKICKDTGNAGLKKCECFSKRIIQQNYERSGAGAMLEQQNFENFNLEVFSKLPFGNKELSPYENTKKIIRQVKNAIDKVDISPCNMLFTGKPGVGKTYLCNCITKALLDKGLSVTYIGAFQMFNDLSTQHFSPDAGNEKNNLFLDSDVLVIDDLGTEIQNSVTYAYFSNIINQRMITNRSTIISSNHTVGEIFEKYGERVGSRLAQNYILYTLYGNDIRMI